MKDKIITGTAILGLIGVLPGCMSNQELKDWGKRTAAKMEEKQEKRKEADGRKLEITFDPYAGGYILKGRYQSRNRFPNITEFRLIGGFDKQGNQEFYKLYVHHMSQTGWKMLESASDIEATRLPVKHVSREVDRINTDALHEHIEIDLSHEYLERNRTKGLNIRILGERGFTIINLDAAYVNGFLDRFDSEKAAKKDGTVGN